MSRRLYVPHSEVTSILTRLAGLRITLLNYSLVDCENWEPEFGDALQISIVSSQW